ncbi:hypothetical protein CASFOL_034680 [Castilleja foliolosa]|uniref:non-specific serine/threonine protein kinase n=1 Tax=Castilleja foliolosa TaxID=1961234 RepID=A0ABD3BQJ0_9LAMI
MNSCIVFVVVLLLLCSSIIYKPFVATSLDLTTDQNALLVFKNTITWNAMLAKNWSSNTSVCNWIGVSCGIKHQRVISLNISGFALSGTLPSHLGNLTFLRYLNISSNDFTGPIPYELSRLYRLKKIDMGVNSFTGKIPSWFGALPQLENLSLHNNTFSGTIPEEIANCSYLQILNLNFNKYLTGPIPYGLFNLSSIKEIRIWYNELSGTLPSDMCNNLPNLSWLSLSDNQIEGQIPRNIWKCRVLEVLSLSHNRLNGEIPSEIGSSSMLRRLYLGFNGFKSGVPVEFGNLSRLEKLNIPLEPIPKQLGNCTSLKSIYLRDNQLTGELPQELGHLAFLEEPSVSNNSLSSSIPSSIFNISSLKYLELSKNRFSGKLVLPGNLNLEKLYLFDNELSGEIPSSITNASMLTLLLLSNNSFSGSIPNFGNLRFLRTLKLWNNNLTSQDQELGFLTSLTNCRFLEYLEISGNPLNGTLPHSLGNLSASLRVLDARICNINGPIPSTIGNLSNLNRIILYGNQLTGSIPPTIGNLKQLEGLYLSGNRLQGYIPTDLCRLSRIGDLYLNGNNLTGPIPDCLGDIRSLRDIDLGSNKLNSTIPSSFWNLKDLWFVNLSSNYLTGEFSSQITSLKVMNVLDLSHNKLSGGIPGSIDGCQTLGFLYLSNNNFVGSIPTSLGNIRGLIALDLSHNNLSGTIPESLEGLNILQYFNVSYNNLEGEIPTGGPFSNFTSQSFLSNSALCGETKFNVPHCIEKDIRPSSSLKKANWLMKYILPPFTSLVILATIIVLLLIMRRRKPKRVAVPVEGVVAWRRISYIELVRGTNDFSETNLLGRGSFGSVFKSTLSDGLDVAVKVFNLILERAVRSFDTECEVLSNIRHRNLVQVVGCCSNPEFKALILEYMPNGSLEKWLHFECYCLDLIQSLQIAIDIASALEYLHHGHTFPIVHCDIKPSNVLLDEDMVAHLADFGISKLFDDGETMVQTKTLATIGYAAPEYGSEGKVSTNGDVYSYGILLLEIFTRKKPTEDMFDEEMSLKDWVHRAIQENAVIEVAAPDLLARDDQHFGANEECISSVFGLAMKCLVVTPVERINMLETVAALQRIKTKVMPGTTSLQQYSFPITTRQ